MIGVIEWFWKWILIFCFWIFGVGGGLNWVYKNYIRNCDIYVGALYIPINCPENMPSGYDRFTDNIYKDGNLFPDKK